MLKKERATRYTVEKELHRMRCKIDFIQYYLNLEGPYLEMDFKMLPKKKWTARKVLKITKLLLLYKLDWAALLFYLNLLWTIYTSINFWPSFVSAFVGILAQ